VGLETDARQAVGEMIKSFAADPIVRISRIV
jgi:hypothetical protein